MSKTFRICATAMLCALSVVANMFTIPLTPNFSRVISFTIVVTFVAAAYLGTISAMTVGFLGDLIAHFINPMGGMGYNYFIGLSCLLTGLIAGLCFKLLPDKRLLALVVGVVACFVVCTTFINNFGLWLQVVVGVRPSPSGFVQFLTMDQSQIRKSFWVFAGARTPVALLNYAINGVLLATLLGTKALDKALAKLLPQESANRQESKK